MALSYNKLWKLLIDKGLTKTQMRQKADISTTTLAKLGKNETVSMEVLLRICKVLDCNVGDNLLELARRANVAIDAPCSGNGSCGKCRIKLVEGELESYPSRHISDEEYAEGWRLSCSSKVVGNCPVFVPDIASAYQSRMKTAALSSPQEVAIFDACQSQLKQSGIHFTNQFRAVVGTMAEPSLDDTMPDNERLERALMEKTGCKTAAETTGCKTG